MGIIGVFSIIGLLVCIMYTIFGDDKKSRIGCAIGIVILSILSISTLLLERYSKNNPITTTSTYKAFRIGNVVFEEPMLIEKTKTDYRYATMFHDDIIIYRVSPLED